MENELKQIIELLKFLPLDIQVKEDAESVEITIKTKDSPIKKEIEDYKDIIENLDDCVFTESMEMLGDKVDISEFDQLLSDPSDREEYLLELIKISKKCIALCIDNKIKELQELKSRL